MDKFLKQMEAFLRGMTLRQRILLVVSAVLVAGVIALFVRLTATADFKTLYAGLSPQDAQAVAQSLSVKNIPYQLSSDGTSVSVPADQLDKTRLALAAEGMPQTGRLGFELFDKPNWAGSDFSEQVNYQRALEGELERTIQTLGSVQSVRVHLVLPHDSLFSDRERVAKAAVVLKLRGGGLTDDEVSAVTHLVASAVDNLSPENVTLIGADGRTPLVAKGRHGRTGGDGSVEMEAAMAEKLVATLAPVVGTDHVKASVTVAWDPSSADTTQELYDPNNPVLVSSQVQEERFGGAPPAGIPGTPSNVPAPPATTTAGSTATAAPAAAGTAATANAAATNQAPAANANPPKPGAPNAANTAAASANTKPGTEQLNPSNPMVSITPESVGQRSESRAYAVSKTLRHTVDPAGRVQKIAVAVLVDDAIVQTPDSRGRVQEARRKRTPEEMKQIEDLARAAVGFDAARGDVISVQNISFLNPPKETPAPLPVTQRVRLVTEQWLWLFRYLALLVLFLLIYALVLRPVKNRVLGAFQLGGGKTAALAGAQAAMAGAQNAGGTAAAPDSSTGALFQTDLERELSQTNSHVERVVRMKKHLVDRVKQEPISASQLIRTWIHEGSR